MENYKRNYSQFIRGPPFTKILEILKNQNLSKGDHVMKAPKEYDYDLWTSVENGRKKCWVRVKRTGEVCEVSKEVLRYLRSEEKSIRRTRKMLQDREGDLHLDFFSDDEFGECWLVDPKDCVDKVIAHLLDEEFKRILSARQMDVYYRCMVKGMGVREYARKHHLNYKSVISTMTAIRKKFYKFYYDTPSKARKMSVDK